MGKIMGDKKYHFLINLTWECQNRCPECWEVLMGRQKNIPPYNVNSQSWEEWAKTLNALPPSVLDISGGEPTLIEGFEELINNLNSKHLIALSTNLRGKATKKIIECGPRFLGINCSWHRGQGLKLKHFINRLMILKKQNYPISVNIVDHPSALDKNELTTLRINGIKVNVSPFENPMQIEKRLLTLKCNAGFSTFTVDPQGDVYRCLTWFRYREREQALLGNLFDGTFKPLPSPRTCNLSCDIFYILDPLHEKKHMFSTYVRRYDE